MPDDVVVLGASLAGLFAAAAAADPSRRVTVVERDHLPRSAQPRPGVAQGQQPHVFLHRGLQVLETLLPGIRADLLARGAVPVDTGSLPWYADLGWTGTGTRGLEILSATRPLLEHAVAERVRALPGVRFVESVRVRGLSRRPASGRDGSPRWDVVLAEGGSICADLVVDASGRGSRMPRWLAAMGIEVPAATEIDARAGYATRMYAAVPEDGAFPGVVVMATPQTRAGAMALRVEGDRYLVLASGYGERRPPRDTEGYLRHLDAVADPAVADLVAGRPALGEVLTYRRTGNQRHHYEDVEGWPDGLLVLGDAFCSFNPVYGQGITVAALEAQALREALHRGIGRGIGRGRRRGRGGLRGGLLRRPFGSRPGDARRLMQRFAGIVDLPWAIATGADDAYVEGPSRQSRVDAVLAAWTREVGRLATHGNERASYTLACIYHLTAPPRLLFHPALLVAWARGRLLGLGPEAERPRELPRRRPDAGPAVVSDRRA